MTVFDAIAEQGVIAIVRADDAAEAETQVRRLMGAGIAATEVSLVTPDAVEVIRRAKQAAAPGSFVGAGTVLDAAEADAVIAAGADFLVSPTLDLDVVAAAIEAGIDVFPGVFTPTEAIAAIRGGAKAVKLFPASLWGPGGLRDLRASLPWLHVVPTGGVHLADAGDWIRAGAMALGVGSALARAADPASAAHDLLDRIAAARAEG